MDKPKRQLKVSDSKMIHFTRWGEPCICPVGFYQVNPWVRGYYRRITNSLPEVSEL